MLPPFPGALFTRDKRLYPEAVHEEKATLPPVRFTHAFYADLIDGVASFCIKFDRTRFSASFPR